MVLEWEPVLKDVISEILETMFFAMVEFQDCGRGDRCFDYESEIELQNHEGRIAISLQLSEEFARMITAGFLGIEENQVKDEDLLRQHEGTGKHESVADIMPESMMWPGNWEYPGLEDRASNATQGLKPPSGLISAFLKNRPALPFSVICPVEFSGREIIEDESIRQ